MSTYTTKHMKTDPNKDFTIKEFYIKVKGDYGKEKTMRVNDLGDKLTTLIVYQRVKTMILPLILMMTMVAKLMHLWIV